MAEGEGRTFLIIGGGASGVILACQFLRRDDPDTTVTLIERRTHLGQGLAYSTEHPGHLLNVRAPGMSMFPDDPDHFSRWRRSDGGSVTMEEDDSFGFAPRSQYGRYLRQTLERIAASSRSRFCRIEGECGSLAENEGGVEALLDDGRRVSAAAAFLAVGYDSSGGGICLDHVGHEDTVLIRGTGLSMVDLFVALAARGHRGRVTALSRRGQLPKVHAPNIPLPTPRADMPMGEDVSQVLRWFRARVCAAQADGWDWRCAIDGLRPHSQALWRGWSIAQRRRFLQHLRPWWDSHRHRMAPAIAATVRKAMADGQLTVVAGRIVAEEHDGPGLRLTVCERGADVSRVIEVDHRFDCTGQSCDPDGSNPVLRGLVARGAARTDPLRLGLDVDADGAVIGSDGRPSPRIFGVGPVTRAALWEITAVPDIRGQCATLAERFLPQQARRARESALVS